jgi:hypothetical protein
MTGPSRVTQGEKLLKIGALVRISVRRATIAMASTYPWQHEFALSHAMLRYTPETLAMEHFPGLGIERARRIIVFAKRHAPHPA